MNEFFRFYIVVNYGQHHTVVETTHQDFTKYVDDMSNEFEIHKEVQRFKMTIWIENYWGCRDEIGYILEKEM